MRDIGSRIQRYRLTRYAPARAPLRRRIRWIWPLLAGWLLWAVALSEHSFYRLWLVRREHSRTLLDLERAREEKTKLERERGDPGALRERAERHLRTMSGMAREGEIVYRIRKTPSDSLARR